MRQFILLVLFLALAACGGGGAKGDDSDANSPGARKDGKGQALKPLIERYEPVQVISGAPLTIYGKHFGASGRVRLDGFSPTISAWSDTTIVLLTDKDFAAGTYNLVVESGVLESEPFQVTFIPIVAGLVPAVATGNDTVLIVGLGFGGSEGIVKIEGVSASIRNWDPGKIEVVVPTSVAAGAQSVVVMVGGQSSKAAQLLVQPDIITASLITTPTEVQIQLTGTNFGAAQGSSTVVIDEGGGTVLSWSAGTILLHATDTLSPGFHTVGVVVGSTPSSVVLLELEPVIRQATPAPLQGGTAVTIAGSFFDPTDLTLSLGMTVLATTTKTASQVVSTTLSTSIAPGTYVLGVATGGYDAERIVTLAPRITGLSNATRSGGDSLTITGVNLGSIKGTATIGGAVTTPTTWSNTSIGTIVPATALPGVQTTFVTGGGQGSNTMALTVVPKVTGVSPGVGSCGSTLGFRGVNFGVAPAAALDGASVAIVNFTATTMHVNGATLGAGSHSLTVTAGGQTSSALAFKCPPKINAITPLMGSGGTVITITGTDFGSSAGSVTVGGATATPTSWSDTSVALTLPNGTFPGSQPVSLIAGGLPSNSLLVTVVPLITGLSKTAAGIGDSIVITGTNFGGAVSTVTIAGLSAAITSWSNTSIQITVPAGVTPGPQEVVVTAATLNSAPFALTLIPKITSLSVPSAGPGDPFTINGFSFGITEGIVSVAGVVANIASWSDTSVSVVMPAGLASGVQPVIITAGGLNSAPFNIIVSVRYAFATASGAPGSGAQMNLSVIVDKVQAIASGAFHTCALTVAGTVKCWGYNQSGQLGNGSPAYPGAAVLVPGLETVQAIAAGGFHTCAITTAGAVKCWGSNEFGQLGYGSTPGNVSGISSGATAIAAGAWHTCAIVSGGLRCWGRNGNGQLGDASTTDRTTPVNVSGLSSGVTAIGGGAVHTCSLITGGAMKCWGSNVYDQLGDGSGTTKTTPVQVSTLTSGVTGISVGSHHTCAITSTGGAKCWGYNSDRQLGDGNTTNHWAPANVYNMTSGVSKLSLGSRHSCALSTTGGLMCWGDNDNGQIGDGSTTSYLPVDVLGHTGNVVAVAAGDSHTCALKSSGTVSCWGSNSFRQLGNGMTTHRNVPTDVSAFPSGIQSIAMGSSHTCVLTTAGGVKCWGNNLWGYLGNNTTIASWAAVDVFGLASGVQAIAAGSGHTCALTTSGGVKCWGYNWGRLGNGTTTTHSKIPVDVTGLASGVKAIGAGGSISCAVTTSGALKCWGENTYGGVGDGTTTTRSSPVTVSGVSGVAAVALGTRHSCALTDGGAVSCWGYNQEGEVGDGTQFIRYSPRAVSGLASGVAFLAAGDRHSCAVLTTGGVRCWGNNGSYQLGDGTQTDRLVPITPSGLASGMQQVSAGNDFSCVLTVTGNVKCWGWNSYGQLGDGTNSVRSTARDVVGPLTGMKALASGGLQSCVITPGDGLECWGYNGTGALGINPGWTPEDSLVPGAVWFGGMRARVTQWGTNTVDFTVPFVTAGIYDVILEVWSRYSTPVQFTVP